MNIKVQFDLGDLKQESKSKPVSQIGMSDIAPWVLTKIYNPDIFFKIVLITYSHGGETKVLHDTQEIVGQLNDLMNSVKI